VTLQKLLIQCNLHSSAKQFLGFKWEKPVNFVNKVHFYKFEVLITLKIMDQKGKILALEQEILRE
jgi:hypothetical protein